MFPDIALQGTAAPETVPSFPVKAATGFEEAFASLLARSVCPLDRRSLGEGGEADPSQLPAPAPGLDPAAAAASPAPWLAEIHGIAEPSLLDESGTVSAPAPNATEDLSTAAEEAAVTPDAWSAIDIPTDVLPADAPLIEPAADVPSNSLDHVVRPSSGADSQPPQTSPVVGDMVRPVSEEITPKIERDEDEEPAPVIVAAPMLAVPLPEAPPVVVESPSLESPSAETPLPVTAMPTLVPQPAEAPISVEGADARDSHTQVSADRAVTPGDDIVREETQQEPVEADLQVGLIEHRELDHARGRIREDAPVPQPQRPFFSETRAGETQFADLPPALRAPAIGRPEEVRARLEALLATLPHVPTHASAAERPEMPSHINVQLERGPGQVSLPQPPEEILSNGDVPRPEQISQATGANTLPEAVAPFLTETARINETESADAPTAPTPPEIVRLETGRARLASILATLTPSMPATSEMALAASVPRQPEHVSQPPEKVTLPDLVAAARDQVASNEIRADLKVGPYDTRALWRPGKVGPYVASHEPQVPAVLAPATGSDAPEANGLQFSVVPVRPMSQVLLNMPFRPPEISSRPTLPAETETARSIVQTLRMQAASGGGTATLTLRPEYLGAVTVSLHVKEGGVVATMQAENSAVRSWIESNVQILRDGLAEQGLKLEQVIVSERQTPDLPEDARRDRQAGEQAPPRRLRRRDDSKFEVLA